jgi:hypothetical protein
MLRPPSPEPPSHVLEHFVNVYVERIHGQPLPLFDPERLLDYLSASPRYLLWSFMAVVLHFETHPFYSEYEAQAVSFYTRSASDSSTKLAADGIARTEVLQANCLLAMRNILCTYMIDADHDIGTY